MNILLVFMQCKLMRPLEKGKKQMSQAMMKMTELNYTSDNDECPIVNDDDDSDYN